MIRAGLLGLWLLGWNAAGEPPEASGDEPVAAAKNDDAKAEALARYNERRESTHETPAAQWALGLWCEKNGLKAEAAVHFAAVVRLDPTREAAWRKLGFKKVRGRWKNDEEIADEAEQKANEKLWAARLKAIHKGIHRGSTRGKAVEALDAVDDPKAVGPIYHEFGGGDADDQVIAVQALGHIDAPLSSKLLALLSVYGKSPDVRRRATETLRGRDPADYLEILAALMADPIKYEVKPVGGPGAPGALFVEGKEYNLRRVYAAPAPNLTPLPGDIVTYDALGFPVIERKNGLFSTASVSISGTKKSGGLDQSFESATVFSGQQLYGEAVRAAVSSQEQLKQDVAELDALNKQRARFTELVVRVAKDATGKNLGDRPEDWREGLAMNRPYDKAKTATTSPRKPTYDELILPSYVPNFGGWLGLVANITSRAPDN